MWLWTMSQVLTKVEHLSTNGKREGYQVEDFDHLEEGIQALGNKDRTDVVNQSYKIMSF
jgi:hypothetical protein